MRRAFTLLEVVVALTIAGIIALAARAAIVAGIDTQERLQVHVTRSEGDARFRALLVQALRHLSDAPAIGLLPFVLRDTTLADGSQAQLIEFYSRGMSQPAGTGSVLYMRVAPSEQGLTISASGPDGVIVVHGVAPGIGAIRVRLQTPAGAWVETWPRSLQTPSAVSLEFTPTGSSPNAAPVPLLVTTQLGAAS
jgi:prepilin-type N-terminal cleavage/methylation domain-containing protein